jgi:hypothetical protein
VYGREKQKTDDSAALSQPSQTFVPLAKKQLARDGGCG